ncbi:MAG: hypothetical protein J2P31_12220, partial [Blastocatellia bacterium]|nr:hypothetical protein [Blastocatellia bacterium]
AHNPAVLIRIETVADALKQRSSRKRPRPPIPLSIQEFTATGSTIPAQTELRALFAGKLAERISTMSEAEGKKAIEAETRQFAGSFLKRSQNALLRAYALKNLTSRFTPAEVLNAGLRAEWLSLVGEHSRMYADEIGEMRVQLQAVIGATEPDDEKPVEYEIKDIAGLFGAIEQLFNLAAANDKVVRSTFAVSTQSTRGSSVKLTQLLRSLIDAERLSRSIQKEAAGKNR